MVSRTPRGPLKPRPQRLGRASAWHARREAGLMLKETRGGGRGHGAGKGAWQRRRRRGGMAGVSVTHASAWAAARAPRASGPPRGPLAAPPPPRRPPRPPSAPPPPPPPRAFPPLSPAPPAPRSQARETTGDESEARAPRTRDSESECRSLRQRRETARRAVLGQCPASGASTDSARDFSHL